MSARLHQNPLSVSVQTQKDILSHCIIIIHNFLKIPNRLRQSILIREASFKNIIWKNDSFKKSN